MKKSKWKKLRAGDCVRFRLRSIELEEYYILVEPRATGGWDAYDLKDESMGILYQTDDLKKCSILEVQMEDK